MQESTSKLGWLKHLESLEIMGISGTLTTALNIFELVSHGFVTSPDQELNCYNGAVIDEITLQNPAASFH